MPKLRRAAASTLVMTVCLTGSIVTASSANASSVKRYSNCKALNAKYPHGVGRKGARDHVSGHTKPVTNFTRNTTVYNANKGRDRDHDGIACEKA